MEMKILDALNYYLVVYHPYRALLTETEAGNRSTSNKVKPFGSPSENLKSKGKPFGILLYDFLFLFLTQCMC
ncbi:hypothetical protein ACSQ67_009965 [Phaseolus vulgaris]